MWALGLFEWYGADRDAFGLLGQGETSLQDNGSQVWKSLVFFNPEPVGDILAAVASPQLWALVGQGLILMDYLQLPMQWNTRDWGGGQCVCF